MITYDKMSGYGNQYMMIKYITVFSNEFKQRGTMKFYNGASFGTIVDAYVTKEKDLKIVCYPHNNSTDVAVLAEKFQGELIQLLENASSEEENHRTAYTMVLDENGPSLLTEDMFGSYIPGGKEYDELFIFDAEPKEGGFPQIYFMQKTQKLNGHDATLGILALSSSISMPPATKITDEGKSFTYSLVRSFYAKKFEKEVPYLSSIDFPTKHKAELPNYLDTKTLIELGESSDSGSVTVSAKGHHSYNEEKKEEIPGGDSEEDAFGYPEQKLLLGFVVKDMVEKGQINLSEIYQAGLAQVLAAIPFFDTIISINPDVPGIARKMCLYEGQYHIVPLSLSEVHEFFANEPDEIFHLCTEDNFPKKLLPSPKTSLIQ
jgi:hypothetical protein